MTIEEAKEALEELKRSGESDEDILKVLYLMYVDGKMNLSDLRGFTELLGYEFTDEFEAMSDEDKKTKGLALEDDAYENATLDEAAADFARMMNISKKVAAKLLSDGVQEGRSYKETMKHYITGEIE